MQILHDKRNVKKKPKKSLSILPRNEDSFSTLHPIREKEARFCFMFTHPTFLKIRSFIQIKKFKFVFEKIYISNKLNLIKPI